MCSVCRKNPCDPRCPNAEEPKPEFYCELCGRPVYGGDEYFETPIDGAKICVECVCNMDALEVLEMCNESLKTA